MTRSAMCGQERDVDDANLAFPTRDIQPPECDAALLDDLKRRTRIMSAVMRALGLELHPAESLFFGFAPTRDRQFLGPRAGVDGCEKGFVFRRDGPEDERIFRSGDP